MSIFHDIQQLIVNDQNNIAPILLKLRLLAAKLGSKELESWIQYESEGYPNNIDVPGYRKIPVSYIADFAGPFNAYIKNAPIPTNLIKKIAGPQWIKYSLKKSISAIEDLLFRQKAGVGIDASNLILLLNNKVYEDYNCISATGNISVSDLVDIQNIVRHRILEFTIQLEKTIPLMFNSFKILIFCAFVKHLRLTLTDSSNCSSLTMKVSSQLGAKAN